MAKLNNPPSFRNPIVPARTPMPPTAPQAHTDRSNAKSSPGPKINSGQGLGDKGLHR